MGSNRKLLFGVLLVVAGLVFLGLYRILSGGTTVAAKPTPAAPLTQNVSTGNGRLIAYAATDIPQGAIITKEMFQMRPLRGGATATGFVTDPEAQALGYITRVPISRGSQLRPDEDFIGHITETGIAGALRPGTRAMTIPLANKPTLHDLIHIGNSVDVNAAFDGQEARTIVQNVRVLAVDVFGSDFPQVNIAARGPYKADPKGQGIAASPATPGAPVAGAPVAGAPAPTPTPTAAPGGQAPARPDAALTLEVTPAQANTILLAQASNATLDFVVRPALPGGASSEGFLVSDQTGSQTGNAAASTVSDVIKPQIAPYAERKKLNGGNSAPAARVASAGERFFNSASKYLTSTRGGRSGNATFGAPPLPNSADGGLPPATLGNTNGGGTDSGVSRGGAGAAPVAPTYDIPIYADGKTVRVETVRRPQENLPAVPQQF